MEGREKRKNKKSKKYRGDGIFDFIEKLFMLTHVVFVLLVVYILLSVVVENTIISKKSFGEIYLEGNPIELSRLTKKLNSETEYTIDTVIKENPEGYLEVEGVVEDVKERQEGLYLYLKTMSTKRDKMVILLSEGGEISKKEVQKIKKEDNIVVKGRLSRNLEYTDEEDKYTLVDIQEIRLSK